MAIAYIQEFDGDDDRSTTGYDAIAARLDVENNPPAGLIVHTAGFGGGMFRIFDVWESAEHQSRFREERLMPIIEEGMANGTIGSPPDREYTYELHALNRG